MLKPFFFLNICELPGLFWGKVEKCLFRNLPHGFEFRVIVFIDWLVYDS